MYWLLQFNAWLSVFMFTLTLVAIVSPRVKDGIIIKIGLMFMMVGYLGCASTLVEVVTPQLIFSSWILTNIGLLIALSGWLLHGALTPSTARRRRSDVLRSIIQGAL